MKGHRASQSRGDEPCLLQRPYTKLVNACKIVSTAFWIRVAPSNGPLPLTGAKFVDWEDLVMREGFEVLAAAMEERAKLDGQSQVEAPGHCPHCGSERTYLEKQSTSNAIRSPVGEIDVQRQHARCRACNGSFSPSAPRLVFAG